MTWKEEIRKSKEGANAQEEYKEYQKEVLNDLKEMKRLAANMKYSFFEIMEDLNIPEDRAKKQAFARFLEDVANLTEKMADSLEPSSSDINQYPEEMQRDITETRSNLRSTAKRNREMASSARTRASDLRR